MKKIEQEFYYRVGSTVDRAVIELEWESNPTEKTRIEWISASISVEAKRAVKLEEQLSGKLLLRQFACFFGK